MDLDVLDCQAKGIAGTRWHWSLQDRKRHTRVHCRELGKALRIPRLELDTSFIALAPTPRPASQPSVDRDSPTCETLDYSYKLLPSGASSPTLSEADHYAALGLALDHQDSLDTGSIIGHTPGWRCRHHATRANLRAQAYSLLSLVIRGRAHPSSRRRRTEAQAAGSSSSMRRLHSAAAA